MHPLYCNGDYVNTPRFVVLGPTRSGFGEPCTCRSQMSLEEFHKCRPTSPRRPKRQRIAEKLIWPPKHSMPFWQMPMDRIDEYVIFISIPSRSTKEATTSSNIALISLPIPAPGYTIAPHCTPLHHLPAILTTSNLFRMTLMLSARPAPESLHIRNASFINSAVLWDWSSTNTRRGQPNSAEVCAAGNLPCFCHGGGDIAVTILLKSTHALAYSRGASRQQIPVPKYGVSNLVRPPRLQVSVTPAEELT